jgi:hypothetical protein
MIVFISQCQTYPQSDSTTLFPTGFHVGSPAVLSIACISNKVNHVFNMTNTNTRSRSKITRRKAQLLLGIFTVESTAVFLSILKLVISLFLHTHAANGKKTLRVIEDTFYSVSRIEI